MEKTKWYDADIKAKRGNPPIMPAVMTPGGPLGLSSALFHNRIIFIGQPVNSLVAQHVISQLLTLASIDEDADILIKPRVGTVCFGVAASQGAVLLAGGEKGMRHAMPNAHIMIHQPQSGCGGHVEDVRRQVKEAVQSHHKIDKSYAAFTGQPSEKVQQYTERERFFSSSEYIRYFTPGKCQATDRPWSLDLSMGYWKRVLVRNQSFPCLMVSWIRHSALGRRLTTICRF